MTKKFVGAHVDVDVVEEFGRRAKLIEPRTSFSALLEHAMKKYLCEEEEIGCVCTSRPVTMYEDESKREYECGMAMDSMVETLNHKANEMGGVVRDITFLASPLFFGGTPEAYWMMYAYGVVVIAKGDPS